jgi:hypothetical protein
MDDGSEIHLSEENFQVRVEKYNNEIYPSAAVLQNTDSVTYTTDADYFTAILNGVTPWFVAFDAVMAVTLWGSFFVLAVLAILHIKGKIRLPLHKLRSIRSSNSVSS